jgi:hypothetical protein
MFREVTMIELKEVLRLWSKGLPKKRVAAQVGLDPKTVRRYLKAATAAGLHADGDPISDERGSANSMKGLTRGRALAQLAVRGLRAM